MKPVNVETLIGHSTGISDSYYRPLEPDLLIDYLKAMPALSIDPANRLGDTAKASELAEAQRRIKELEAGQTRMDHLEQESRENKKMLEHALKLLRDRGIT